MIACARAKVAVSTMAAMTSVICPLAIAAEKSDPSAPATTPPAAANASDWRSRFDAVYRLEEGQTLKYIPSPFIPERLQYYRTQNPSQARAIPEGPQVMTFHWDGNAAQRWVMSFGGRGCRLDRMIPLALRIPNYQFEAPTSILKLQLPDGDFIIRRNASEADRLVALLRIYSDRTGRSLSCELQNLDREVIVARGHYDFHSLPDSEVGSAIQLYSDVPDRDAGGGGGSGTLGEFLRLLGSQAGRRVIDETDGPHLQGVLQWRTFRSSYLDLTPEGEDRTIKTDQLLAIVAQQTDLSLIRERRKVPVWVISEK